MAGIFDFIFGKEGGMEKFETMSPEQKQFLNSIMQQLGGGGQLGQGYGQSLSNLQELLDPTSAAQQRFAQPYMDQFQQQTVPQLAERFAGAGAQGGALSSSGFGQALGAAGSDLQSQLAQLKSQLQMGAGKDIMSQFSGMASQALGAQPFGYQQKQAQPGLAGYWAQGGFPGAKQGFQGLSNMWSNYGPVMGNV